MSANKFKVGDKVRVRRDLIAGKFYGDMCCGSTMARMGGDVLTIDYIGAGCYGVNENIYSWSDEMLEPFEKTLYNLCAGDFVNSDGCIRKVLAVADCCYLLSSTEDYTMASSWYTVDDLKRYGYIPVEPSTPESIIEIGDKKYNKAEVEEAIKDLEPIE